MQSKFIKEINKMETLNYKVLEGTGYNGYILKDAPVKVMQFGEGNFLRAFVDYFYDRVCTPCTCAAAKRARRWTQSG